MTLSLSSAHLTPQHHPFVTRHHQLRQNNPHPCPKRLQLLRQILASIEHDLKRAIEVAVVVPADRVEHIAASGSAGRQC